MATSSSAAPTRTDGIARIASCQSAPSDGQRQTTVLHGMQPVVSSNSNASNNKRSQQDQRPRNIPVRSTEQAEKTIYRRSAGLRQQEEAPLASLELNISEHFTGDQPRQRQSKEFQHLNSNQSTPSSSTVETPTLSGYFDCDELSDMVDDSLFEITTAGCLSRSVFGPRTRHAAANQSSRTGRPSKANCSNQSDGDDEAEPENEGQRTPTNEGKTGVVGGATDAVQSREVMEGEREPMEEHEEQWPADIPARGARQPRDYSRASKVAKQLETPHLFAAEQRRRTGGGSCGQWEQQSGSSGNKRVLGAASQATQAQPRRRSKTHRASDRGAQTVAADEATQQNRLRPPRAESHLANCSSSSSGQSSPPSNRQAADNCALCQQGQAQQLSKTTRQRKEKRGRRSRLAGAFGGLLNLFGGGATPATAQATMNGGAGGEREAAQLDKIRCPHRWHHDESALIRGAGEPVESLTNGGSGAQRSANLCHKRPLLRSNGGGKSLPSSRVRDSIRVTNQRKMRNNSSQRTPSNKSMPKNERSVSSKLVDSGQKLGTNEDAEVLLELACSLHRRPGVQQQQQSGASIKCVKFSTPDQVMILSPAPPPTPLAHNGKPLSLRLLSHSSSTLSLAAKQRSQGQQQQQMAAANLTSTHAPAPIIKRSTSGNVPKSSSYSQTEPNRGLDELLAHYETNMELVSQINEKLKLTETIASNLSALDEPQQKVEVDEAEMANGMATNRLLGDVVAPKPGTTSSDLFAADQNGERKDCDEDGDARSCLCNASAHRQEISGRGPRRKSSSTTASKSDGDNDDFEHERSDSDDSSNTSEPKRSEERRHSPSLAEGDDGAEEAGFSRLWLSKQRAMA